MYTLMGESMSKLPDLVPVTDLRQDATAVLKKVSVSRDPMIITQRGRAAAVLMSVAAYERSQNATDILRMLMNCERETSSGKGHSLKQVMKEAGQFLRESEK